MEITIRQAVENDHKFLAEVMHDAMAQEVGRGAFDVALEGTGVDALTFHSAMLVNRASNWSQIEDFFVLDAGDEGLVGAAGSFLSSLPDLRPLTPEGFTSVSDSLGWSETTARGFWRKYVTAFGLFGNAPQLAQPAEYVMEYCAVRPDLRGRGLYGRLSQAHVDRAASLGYKTVGCTAMFGNESAYKSLTKFGFRDHSRFGPEYYRGAYPGLTRLVYEIPHSEA